jgi:hypothetical protein
MKLRITALALAALILSILISGTADARPRHRPVGPRWEFLGERTVTDAVDHDVIPVTVARGTFRSLKLEVRDRGVDFHSMKIHFGDGETQEVVLRQTIPAGGESRIIDVEGRERVIRSIEFVYDARSLLGKKARVQVWGRS